MIYRMDSTTFMTEYLKKESLGAIYGTYYASISRDVVTSGQAFKNVWNWSALTPSTKLMYIETSLGEEHVRYRYFEELDATAGSIVAEKLLKILENNDRLIIIHATSDKNYYYPKLFAEYLEDRFKIAVYEYGESPSPEKCYDRMEAIAICKHVSKISKIDTILRKYPYTWSRDEMKFVLKQFGEWVKGMTDEEMAEIVVDIKRDRMRKRL